VDEEIKKRLFDEMRRIFQDGYDNLIEEIERLKKELADPGDNLHKRQFVLSREEVIVVLSALYLFKGVLEDRIDFADKENPRYKEDRARYFETEDLIGIVEDVLYGNSLLIYKRSA